MFNVKFREMLLQTPGLFEELDAFYKKLNAWLLISHDDDGTLTVQSPVRASTLGLPIGAIQLYAGASVPGGWLLCDGSAVSRSDYSALFAVISTTYGVGDGVTTFTLPDLRGKFPLGKAASGTGATLGSTGGLIDHTHTGPSHTHTSSTGTAATGVDVTFATTPTNASGSGNTGTANPPFLALNYLVLVA